MTKLATLEMLDRIYRESDAKLRDASKLHTGLDTGIGTDHDTLHLD